MKGFVIYEFFLMILCICFFQQLTTNKHSYNLFLGLFLLVLFLLIANESYRWFKILVYIHKMCQLQDTTIRVYLSINLFISNTLLKSHCFYVFRSINVLLPSSYDLSLSPHQHITAATDFWAILCFIIIIIIIIIIP
jgi:uncharacterized membrane protein YidH (DUF202 family)